MGTKGNNDVLAHIIHYRPLIMTDDNINVVQGSPHSLPSDDVDFPDIFLPTASEAPSTLQKDFVPREKTNTASQSDETMNTESSNSVGNETTMTGGPVSAQQEQEVRPLPLSLQTSLKEHVKPGETKRDQFPLVPSKVALLIIDIQEYLSSPSSVQDEQGHAYFYQTSLPRATQNIQQLVQQTRRRRDSQAQGCEVIFTYLEALTQDCRDVSLDYKLSGPSLANIPNSASSPATFLECIAPLHDGKGDIVIPKTSCSVFMSTNIHYVLQNLHVEQLLICGQLTDQCVESAVRDAADLGYFVTVIEDACAAQSHEAHLKGISGMKGFSRCLSTAQVLDELENGRDDIVVSKRVVPTEPSDEEEIKPITTRNEPAEPKSLKHIPIITTTEWSPPSCNEKAVTTALLHTMKFAGVQFLRYMAVDACNSIRCKAVPIHHLLKTKRLDNQISIAQVCFAGLPTFGDYMSESTGLDARKVLTILPDVGSLRILPYASTSAVVFGSAIDPISQTVSPLCTRSLLSRVVETARRYGIEFSVGVEIEFCLFRGGEPVDQSVFGNVTTMNEQEAFLSDLDIQLQQQQVQVEQVHAESAPGQVELVLKYSDDVLQMADSVVLARETMTAVASRHGLTALFLPKVFSDKAGNGCHIHVSFQDTLSPSKSRNAVCHASLNGELSFKAKSFLEGILQHLPALLSLTLPTNNSFRRVGPGCWTGSSIGWDLEDKEAALRVCMDTKTRQLTNIEYKLCDSTANIYLALSSILACGLQGIVSNLSLRPALRGQEKEWKSNRENEEQLPSSLQESLECLSKNVFLSEQVLGPELCQAYIATRRAASEKFHSLSLEKEVAMALNK